MNELVEEFPSKLSLPTMHCRFVIPGARTFHGGGAFHVRAPLRRQF